MSKVFILHLMFDPMNQPGAMSYEVLGVSLDRSKIEELQVIEQKKLDEELGNQGDEDSDDEDLVQDFRGYDTTCAPYLMIEEKDLL